MFQWVAFVLVLQAALFYAPRYWILVCSVLVVEIKYSSRLFRKVKFVLPTASYHRRIMYMNILPTLISAYTKIIRIIRLNALYKHTILFTFMSHSQIKVQSFKHLKWETYDICKHSKLCSTLKLGVKYWQKSLETPWESGFP